MGRADTLLHHFSLVIESNRVISGNSKGNRCTRHVRRIFTCSPLMLDIASILRGLRQIRAELTGEFSPAIRRGLSLWINQKALLLRKPPGT